MNLISFKKLKLFKSPEILANKEDDSGHPAEKLNPLKKLLQNPFTFLIIFVALIAYLISYIPSRSLPELEVGEIASSDIVSPVDLTIEDTETTAQRKRDAEDGVYAVYSFDPNVFLNTEEKIRQFFASGREWLRNPPLPAGAEMQKRVLEKFGVDIEPRDMESLARINFPPDLEGVLITLIDKVSTQGIIVSKNLFTQRETERGMIVAKGPANEKLTKVDEILDVKEGKSKISEEVDKLDIPQRNKRLLKSLASAFLAPNLTFNKVETERRKELARQRVETVFYTIKKGKVIIRKGDEAGVETLKWIKLINQNLKMKAGWFVNFLGTFLLFALLFISLWYYLKSLLKFKPAIIIFIMMGTTLVVSLLAYKLSAFIALTSSEKTNVFFLKNAETYRYAFPYQFGALIFAFLTYNHITLIFSILNGLLVGYLFKMSFYQMMFAFIGGLAAIYGINYYRNQKRTSMLRAGLFIVAPANIFVLTMIYLIREEVGGMGILAGEILMGILGGVLSASLAFLLLPVFENIFGFFTPTKLLELTNSDLPIFRQMAIEAPGSYHHSLIVASLAEKAAEELKLDSMLVKAGALYHDIGKVKRPEYFIENTSRTADIHRDLTPSMSTLVITNHVKEGVEMAKKLKLPRNIRDIIEQHHGSSLVKYFYQKAKEKYDPEMQEIGEEPYRYPGPPPQSKETALILLADSVEAASRSIKNPTRENLKRVIIDIFDNYLQDGQLDDSDFSLKELRTIAASFLSTLYTIYHPRVKYPGFDFEGKRPKKSEKNKKPNNGNHQPSA